MADSGKDDKKHFWEVDYAFRKTEDKTPPPLRAKITPGTKDSESPILTDNDKANIPTLPQDKDELMDDEEFKWKLEKALAPKLRPGEPPKK